MITANTYQQLKVCFIGGVIKDFFGKLSAQTSDGFTYVFDDDALLVSINNNNTLWMEWVK